MIAVIGIDPAQRENGFAFGVIGEGQGWSGLRTGSFDGMENLLRAEELWTWCHEQAGAGVTVHVCIECPTWSGHGTKEVRSSALAWERELQRALPRRRIWKLDPRTWQSALLSGLPHVGTKGASMIRAGVLGVEVSNDHEADAACLAEYAHFLAKGMAADGHAKKQAPDTWRKLGQSKRRSRGRR